MSRAMTGAQMVLEALADQGVEHIFGYPGGDATERVGERRIGCALHPALGVGRHRERPLADAEVAANSCRRAVPGVHAPLTSARR